MSSIRLIATFAVLMSITMLTACSSTPRTEQERERLDIRVASTIERFKEADPSIEVIFDTAHAYVVFPAIAKGGAGIGGAHGHGQAYEDGNLVGYAEVSQGTIGFQLGGQSFSQIIFFNDKAAFNQLREGSLAFAAQASAVAASRGAAASAEYERGVMVFTMTNTGLMFEASIGGQKFNYYPVE